ncbi:hypothetical protein AB3S75_014282 [Citrus x aurantiifolia]
MKPTFSISVMLLLVLFITTGNYELIVVNADCEQFLVPGRKGCVDENCYQDCEAMFGSNVKGKCTAFSLYCRCTYPC